MLRRTKTTEAGQLSHSDRCVMGIKSVIGKRQWRKLVFIGNRRDNNVKRIRISGGGT